MTGRLPCACTGSPTRAHTWRYLLPELAGAGFRAVAPFLRGYAPTQMPADGRYQIGAIVRDANALHEALGGDDGRRHRRPRLGRARHLRRSGAPARPLAPRRHGSRPSHGVDRDVAVHLRRSCGGAGTCSSSSRRPPRWRSRSTTTPSSTASGSDWSPGYDGAWDVAKVKESIGDPEHILAAIGYYRALWDTVHPGARVGRRAGGLAAADTQADPVPARPRRRLHVASIASAAPLDFLAAGSEMEIVEGTGHFLHVERPDVVNARILGFLPPQPPGGTPRPRTLTQPQDGPPPAGPACEAFVDQRRPRPARRRRRLVGPPAGFRQPRHAERCLPQSLEQAPPALPVRAGERSLWAAPSGCARQGSSDGRRPARRQAHRRAADSPHVGAPRRAHGGAEVEHGLVELPRVAGGHQPVTERRRPPAGSAALPATAAGEHPDGRWCRRRPRPRRTRRSGPRRAV